MALLSEDFREVCKCYCRQTPLSPKELSILTEEQAQLHIRKWRTLIFYKYFTYILCKAVPTLNRTEDSTHAAPDRADEEAAGSIPRLPSDPAAWVSLQGGGQRGATTHA